VLALLQHPEQLAELMQSPALMPSAVEEILRWTSPANYFMRVATQDCELHGKPIKRGDRVVVWFTSANRDEEVFAEPFRFDIKRSPNDHLAFGYGEHFCLGARLARMETRVMLEEILRGLPGLQLAGEIERMYAVVVSVIKRMPVRFAPIA
jgi:cytochrome P450